MNPDFRALNAHTRKQTHKLILSRDKINETVMSLYVFDNSCRTVVQDELSKVYYHNYCSYATTRNRKMNTQQGK